MCIFGGIIFDMKPEIEICLGSSCFSRGNKKLVHWIKAYLDERMLNDKVVFRGAHCFDACASGPSMRLGGEFFYHLDEEKVQAILDQWFSKMENSAETAQNEL